MGVIVTSGSSTAAVVLEEGDSEVSNRKTSAAMTITAMPL